MEDTSSFKQITKRSKDYSQWYQDVIESAGLAEHSPVKGCMVIKPYGYAIWENMRNILDQKFKKTGHQNAYFPLFIPKSFLSKEAHHIEGFAKECAVVTHYRLKSDEDGKGVVVDPEAKLEEELVVRPTSETIIYATFAKWIKSWRDLPLLINQWANIVRWEMRTRLFLRTTEFLWQEGHTAHATEEEAEQEALKMLDIYKEFCENYLAIPVIAGEKSSAEKFAGAMRTYTIEAMMQDGRALQMGTSHNLGQNFARAFEVKFTDKDGLSKFVWQTSWGVSTRLIGGLIMAHSDDDGLILPPNIAPIKIVIIPIWTDDSKEDVLNKARRLKELLGCIDSNMYLDERDYCTPGFKFNEWEKKGVPLRIEIGPKDIVQSQVVLVRRDTKEKSVIPESQLVPKIQEQLSLIQAALLEKAKVFRSQNSYNIDKYDDFQSRLEEQPGFIYSHWCGKEECELQIAEETKATIRCLLFDQKEKKGRCIKCGGESRKMVVFAKAY